MSAATISTACRIEGDHEAEAGGVHVEGRDARAVEADAALDQYRRGRDALVGQGASGDDAVDSRRLESRRGQRSARGLDGQVDGRFAGDDGALAHADDAL
jgi:hypothetical protein